MKRIFFILAPILFLLSCSSPRYVQLATLYSDTVSLSQGQYKYSDDIVCVEYMFNTEDGVFLYTISNLTDSDIYVDMEESLFVYNSQVFDYAGRDTYFTFYSNTDRATCINYSYYTAYLTNFSKGIAVTQSRDIPSKVLIPKGCYRVFTGFDLNDTVYRQLYFARDPSANEDIFLLRDNMIYPIDFINIIHVISGVNEYNVVNKFEVATVRNILLSSKTIVSVDPSMYYTYYSEDDVFYYRAGTLILNDDRSPHSSDIKATDLNNKTVYLM